MFALLCFHYFLFYFVLCIVCMVFSFTSPVSLSWLRLISFSCVLLPWCFPSAWVHCVCLKPQFVLLFMLYPSFHLWSASLQRCSQFTVCIVCPLSTHYNTAAVCRPETNPIQQLCSGFLISSPHSGLSAQFSSGCSCVASLYSQQPPK